MVLSFLDAETISMSPSLSISAANTERAPDADVAILAAVHEGSAAPSFSYQAMVLSFLDAETISLSPSLSKSATYIKIAPSALV